MARPAETRPDQQVNVETAEYSRSDGVGVEMAQRAVEPCPARASSSAM